MGDTRTMGDTHVFLLLRDTARTRVPQPHLPSTCRHYESSYVFTMSSSWYLHVFFGSFRETSPPSLPHPSSLVSVGLDLRWTQPVKLLSWKSPRSKILHQTSKTFKNRIVKRTRLRSVLFPFFRGKYINYLWRTDGPCHDPLSLLVFCQGYEFLSVCSFGRSPHVYDYFQSSRRGSRRTVPHSPVSPFWESLPLRTGLRTSYSSTTGSPVPHSLPLCKVRLPCQ